ncbi:MAG: 4'-phosphopantetheinyl transferase superfamily protein [Methylocystis sp.]|uniref:4'-phosphopantetheinyl transferase superfamily protein n=1 Tax=Methylocystis sp. TaxID=1911079 RepID=UPI003D13E5A1
MSFERAKRANGGDAAAWPNAGATGAPLIARMYEVQDAQELARAAEDSGGEGAPHSGPSGPSATDAVRNVADMNGADAGEPPRMPFIGSVLEYFPGEGVTIERKLSVYEDLYLADHAFVHAPGIKPASACLPVVPMTMSLEIMAEAAACLAPGYGLIGFEDVRSVSWIDLADVEELTLTVTARLLRQDPERGAFFISTTIQVEGKNSPAITAIVLFGNRYLVELSPSFTEFNTPHAHPLTGEEIYAERRMFHGPSFQCLSGEYVLGDEGIIGELCVRSPEALFASTQSPQLLTDPCLLDAVGQIVGLWAMEQERYVFPIGLSKLEIYLPTPPVGTRAPVRVEIMQSEGKTLLADIEVQDGAGGVWMRISGWRNWKFRWEKRLVDFRRLPDKYLLASQAPGAEGDGSIALMLSGGDLQQFDPALLARYFLSVDEMSAYKNLERFPQRQRQWLHGRVAAKDAVRLWAARGRQDGMSHPAAFDICADERGCPFVEASQHIPTAPSLSIAHCEDRAIAVAHELDVGVDIERIVAREARVVEAFASPQEREMIANFPSSERDTWITRLWCAKEAVGKLLGVGLEGKPLALLATEMTEDGKIVISHQAENMCACVTTIEDDGFIIAYAGPEKAHG